MKLAVVAGGWHWPLHFFRKITTQMNGADLFVVAHRNPELPVVREEKREILEKATGSLADLDRELYAQYPTVSNLRSGCWDYSEEPNLVGDWGFFNQWLEKHDYKKYDVILNCHDDTYIRRDGLFDQLSGNWLILANGSYSQQPTAYVRGSFEFWKREMLDLLGGHIDLGKVAFTREGKTNTADVTAWNSTCRPLRRMMAHKNMADQIAYLSPYYRISKWVIEGERGFMHLQNGCSASFAEGLKAYPLEGVVA